MLEKAIDNLARMVYYRDDLRRLLKKGEGLMISYRIVDGYVDDPLGLYFGHNCRAYVLDNGDIFVSGRRADNMYSEFGLWDPLERRWVSGWSWYADEVQTEGLVTRFVYDEEAIFELDLAKGTLVYFGD